MDDMGERDVPTVLVVDDDPGVRRAAKQSGGGAWIVRTASSLDAARRSIQAKPPNFVVVDLLLRKERGFELIRELGRSHPALPTALLSGSFTIELVSRACWAGVRVFALKPVSLREIVRDLAAINTGEITELPHWIRRSRSRTPRTASERQSPDEERARHFGDVERDAHRYFLEQALERNGWNLSRTAEDIRMSRSKLHALLAALELERDRDD